MPTTTTASEESSSAASVAVAKQEDTDQSPTVTLKEPHQDQADAAAAQSEKNEEEIRYEELNMIKQFVSERDERIKFKLELRERNLKAAASRPDENHIKKLDSTLKKITPYIKRLKNLTESQKDSLAKELVQLNLTKYVSEVAQAFTEVKLKMNDINCALHLCSLMHQYYADFSPVLFECWQRVLNLKKDDKVANPSKLRVDLRFFAELVTTGVLPEKEALSLLGNQLTIMTVFDKDHANITIITSFCKHCGEDFADLVPSKIAQLADKHKFEMPRNHLYSADRQKAVKNLFKEYYKTLSVHLVTDHKEVKRLERQNRKILQTKGELNTDKKEKCEQAVSAYQKLLQNTEMLADLLCEQMPELPVDEQAKREEEMIHVDIYMPGRFEDFDSSTSPWEDEETRQFYECLPDLKVLVPGILYKDSEKASTNILQSADATTVAAAAATTGEEIKESDIESIVKDVEQEASSLKDEAQNEQVEDVEKVVAAESEQICEEESGNTTIKLLMDAFVGQLPNCVNRELIDKAAKDFCMNLNTKVNRKRLVQALFLVQRTRLDLLPFYSRLVAILNPCMPEVANDLFTLLFKDFRFHIKKKDQINIESKIKNARFIGELVKFKMFPKKEAMTCLKSLAADFQHHNIEMACNMLETCGRYLYRNTESHVAMKLILETFMRKKQTSTLDSRYSVMIENAFYYCNPPENKQVEKKARIPIHEYIKKLLYKDLNKLTVEKVLRQMRKINWKDEELFSFTIRSLIGAWNVKYNAIHCLANLVSGLASYHEEVGIHVVDGVIEDIRLGLEVNVPKFNQRRISMVKYLGELYNYRMVESSIIFKTLYTILTYAAVYDVAQINDLDPADNYFRVRLICTLLDTCGQYFDHGSSKKKLDCFLLYFQRYFWFKKDMALNEEHKHFPIDTDYVYTDTLSTLRSGFKFATNYQQATDLVNEMEKEMKENLIKMMNNENKDGVNLDAICEEDELKEEEGDDEEDGEEDTEMAYGRDRYRDDRGMGDDENNRNSFTQYDDTGAGGAVGGGPGGDQYSDNDNEGGPGGNTEDEKEDLNVVLQSRSRAVLAKEDDDFVKAFDQLVADNVQQRAKEAFKTPTVDIALPMTHKRMIAQNENNETANNFDEDEESAAANSVGNSDKKTFNFVFMVKKGNKPQFHNLQVPVTSDFAAQFKAREEAEKVEKEKLKELTLTFNKRMEQEELQEFISKQSMSVNTNRERKQKYNHPKGAPDADLIFGSK